MPCPNPTPHPPPPQDSRRSPAEAPRGLRGWLWSIPVLAAGLFFALQGAPEPAVQPTADSTLDLSAFREVPAAQIGYRPSVTIPLPTPATALTLASAGGFWVGCGEAVLRVTLDGKVKETHPLSAVPTALLEVEGQLIIGLGSRVVRLHGERIEPFLELTEQSLVTALASAEGRLAVADTGARRVHLYDLAGKRLLTLGDPNPETGDDGLLLYSANLGVVFDPSGLLFITDPGRHRLKTYTNEGQLVGAWESAAGNITPAFNGCCNPCRITGRGDGAIVTSEKGLARVKVYDRAGRFVTVVAPPKDLPEGGRAAEIAVDKAGTIWVAIPGNPGAAGRLVGYVPKPGDDGVPSLEMPKEPAR